jgi:hypothetical protein
MAVLGVFIVSRIMKLLNGLRVCVYVSGMQWSLGWLLRMTRPLATYLECDFRFSRLRNLEYCYQPPGGTLVLTSYGRGNRIVSIFYAANYFIYVCWSSL